MRRFDLRGRYGLRIVQILSLAFAALFPILFVVSLIFWWPLLALVFGLISPFTVSLGGMSAIFATPGTSAKY